MHPGPPRLASEDEQFLGGRGKNLSCARRPSARADDQGVLDPDAALAGQVNPWLDGDGHPVHECTCPAIPDDRCFVYLQADAVAQAVLEAPTVTGRLDEVPGRRVDVADVRPGDGGRDSGQLRGRDQLVDLALPVRGLAERHGPGHVRVITAESRSAVDRDQVTRL